VLCENRSRILGLGIASPGPVNIETGISLYYKYIKGWENVPVGSFFKKQCKFPVYLESNLRAIASAELWFGQGRPVDQFVSIAVRSGIGAGIVMRGEVCRGAHSGAGEIGAWRVPASFLNKPLIKSVFGSGRQHVELEEIASVRSVLKNISTCIADGQTSSLPVDQAITVIDVLEAYHQDFPDRITEWTGFPHPGHSRERPAWKNQTVRNNVAQTFLSAILNKGGQNHQMDGAELSAPAALRQTIATKNPARQRRNQKRKSSQRRRGAKTAERQSNLYRLETLCALSVLARDKKP
jgi:hypothetical protein